MLYRCSKLDSIRVSLLANCQLSYLEGMHPCVHPVTRQWSSRYQAMYASMGSLSWKLDLFHHIALWRNTLVNKTFSLQAAHKASGEVNPGIEKVRVWDLTSLRKMYEVLWFQVTMTPRKCYTFWTPLSVFEVWLMLHVWDFSYLYFTFASSLSS